MDSRAVIGVIKQHQAKFRERSRSRVGVEMTDEVRVSRSIAEEYDSLLAEIEALMAPKENEKARVLNRVDERTNAVAESQILGDQGQSGGWSLRV
jgi:hypothetical protein